MPFPFPAIHVRHYVKSDDSVPRLFDAYYYTDSDVGTAIAMDIAAAAAQVAHDAMQTAMTAWLAGDSHYLGCTAHVYKETSLGVGDETSTTGAVGTLEGDSEPDYVAAVIRRYADGRLPRHRGRVFIPLPAEINTDTSRLNVDGLAGLAGIRDALDADLDLTDTGEFGADLGLWQPAHYSRNLAQLLPVVKWIAEDVLVTQRRRRLRPLQ